MNTRTAFAGVVLACAVFALGYVFATGMPLNHEITYLAILAGFAVSDRSFWPKRDR